MEEILAKLVAFPTMTGNFEANDELLEYVGSYLEERGMYVDRYSWNEYGALVATTRLGKSPAIMFAAHSDVVPAPPNMFTVHKEGDKLYGLRHEVRACGLHATSRRSAGQLEGL
jgi:acetylornithine deacetylase/succinyl-diaminopimelate desuccinylase-like protein